MLGAMKQMLKLPKLKAGDKVAVVSPSFAAPGKWPHVYELGLKRLREVFQLDPIEFPTTKKIGASKEERARDLMDAFDRSDIKGVIASLGGNDQIMYVKNLPAEPFINNPKPFFGFSDNSHFANHLWLQGIPSYYGGSILTQFAMQKVMDDYTVQYLKYAWFEEGEREITPSESYNDKGLDWNDPTTLDQKREYEPNEGWSWDGGMYAEGITWGGCLESIDEMLRHGIQIPSLEDFDNTILITETSEEIPTPEYVFRVYRALGERGILGRVKGVLVGRPKAWEFDKPLDLAQRREYRRRQRETVLGIVRVYNPTVPIVQNMDFGHTDPQIPMPYGGQVRIDSDSKKIFAVF